MVPQPSMVCGAGSGVVSVGAMGMRVIFAAGILKARPNPMATAARTDKNRPGGFASRIGRKKITPKSRMASIANMPSGGGLTEPKHPQLPFQIALMPSRWASIAMVATSTARKIVRMKDAANRASRGAEIMISASMISTAIIVRSDVPSHQLRFSIPKSRAESRTTSSTGSGSSLGLRV